MSHSPYGANSAAAVSDSPLTAHFDAQYPLMPGCPLRTKIPSASFQRISSSLNDDRSEPTH